MCPQSVEAGYFCRMTLHILVVKMMCLKPPGEIHTRCELCPLTVAKDNSIISLQTSCFLNLIIFYQGLVDLVLQGFCLRTAYQQWREISLSMGIKTFVVSIAGLFYHWQCTYQRLFQLENKRWSLIDRDLLYISTLQFFVYRHQWYRLWIKIISYLTSDWYRVCQVIVLI